MDKLETPKVDDGWVDAIQGLLGNPDRQVSAELRALLSEAIIGSHTTLPPRVFYQAVQQSAVAISITDPNANILYANQAFSSITGYAQNEVVGKNESLLSDKNTPIRIYKEMWAALQAKQPWSGKLVNRRKDGQRYIANLTIAPVLNVDGAISHYLGMHRDVTEEHLLTRELKNSKDLLESVVDIEPVAIVLLDNNNQLVRDNQAYRQLRQEFPQQELVATLCKQILGERSETELMPEFAEREVRLDLGGASGARWFSCSCTHVEKQELNADSFFESHPLTYRLFVAKEITEVKKQQESVRINSLRALMAEEEMVQSVRETLAGAIYQLQVPLNLVAAAANMIDRRGSAVNMDNLRLVLKEAMMSGSKALDTLNSSMPVSSEQPMITLNVNEILHDVLMLKTKALLANGVVVEWKPVPTLPAVVGRERSLRAIFSQLVDNAIEAMSDRRNSVRELVISTAQPDIDIVEVLVKDSGPGIPEEDRLRVFQPFFSTKGKKGTHTGMGLAMVQDVINEHGGSIEILHENFGGCCMKIQLPTAGQSKGGIA